MTDDKIIEVGRPAGAKSCPFMSGSPAPVPKSLLEQSGTVSFAPMLVPCQGEGCQLWDEVNGECLVPAGILNYNLGGVASTVQELKAVLEPASNGPVSALSDIAAHIGRAVNALVRLCETIERRSTEKKSGS